MTNPPSEESASSNASNAAGRLQFALRRYLATLEAIAELLDLIPSVQALDRRLGPKYIQFISEATEGVNPTERQHIRDAASAAFGALLTEFREATSAKHDEGSHVEREPRSVTLGQSDLFKQSVANVHDLSNGAIESDAFVGSLFDTFIAGPRITVARQGVLLRSLLTTSVSAYESLLADIAGVYFRHAPGAMGTDDVEFSLKQLLALPSVDSAIEIAIDHRVEDILRKGFEGQLSWLRAKDKLGLSPQEHVQDWDRLNEAMERRHCIVHHGSMVSSQYVRKVRGTKHLVGERLSVSIQYLNTTLDDLAEFGIYIALASWKKLGITPDIALAGFIRDDGYKLLQSRSWRRALAAFDFGVALDCKEDDRLVFQVNRWLCRKRLHGIDVIRAEVDKWDTSALDQMFTLAKACLADNIDRALSVAERLLNNHAIPPKSILEWPLLEELRSDPRFEERLGSLLATEDEEAADNGNDQVDNESSEDGI